MVESSIVDSLAGDLHTIEELCSSMGLFVIPGWPKEQTALPTLVFDVEGSDRIRQYLSTAKHLNAGLLALNVLRLTEEAIEKAIRRLAEMGGGTEQARMLTEIDQCRHRIGHIASIELYAYIPSPNLILCLYQPADWFRLIYNTEDLPEESDFAEEEAEDPRYEELARVVAESEEFLAAKNRAQREYAVKSVLKGNPALKELDIFQIAEDANTIFKMEILPKLEKDVRRLHSEGLDPSKIAEKVKLPVKQVKAML